MGNIRIHILSNNSAYKTDGFYPLNQSAWNSLLTNEAIDVPVYDSNQVIRLIKQSNIEIPFNSELQLTCRNINGTIWTLFNSSEGNIIANVDATTGEIL